MEEKEIIQSILSGNTTEFSRLYDAYIEKIYRFVYFKTRHKETSEDLTSDVFVKALSKIRSFNPEKASFSVWLYRIARNTIIDHYRTKKETVGIEDAWDLASIDNVADQAHASLSLKEVETYMRKLKPEQRDLVVLRVWQDLSYKEISEIMNKSENSLKVSFSRIIRSMRKEIGPMAIVTLYLINRI